MVAKHLRRRYRLLSIAAVLLLMSATTTQAGGPPQFSDFTVFCDSGNVWVAVGTVEDEDPATCTVAFGGPFDGNEVHPYSDGYFEITVELHPEESGIVTALVYDIEGHASDVVREYIQ